MNKKMKRVNLASFTSFVLSAFPMYVISSMVFGPALLIFVALPYVPDKPIDSLIEFALFLIVITAGFIISMNAFYAVGAMIGLFVMGFFVPRKVFLSYYRVHHVDMPVSRRKTTRFTETSAKLVFALAKRILTDSPKFGPDFRNVRVGFPDIDSNSF
ncbi:MAG: hypothetical protein HC806_03740 [Anaerolineae bacterium]|nr:hypothetical protein [Anaerolineae bacterium]